MRSGTKDTFFEWKLRDEANPRQGLMEEAVAPFSAEAARRNLGIWEFGNLELEGGHFRGTSDSHHAVSSNQ